MSNKFITTTRSLLILILVSIVTTSCGFHLRGSTPQAEAVLSRLYLSEKESSPVANELRYLLEANNTALVTERSLAEYHLLLNNYNVEQTVLSVSASTGKAEEYQLQLSIRVTISDKEEKAIVNNQMVRVTRDYAFDETAVLGSVTERDVLINEMTKLAAVQITQILGTLNN